MIDDGLLDRIWEALEDAKRGQGLPIIFKGLNEVGKCTITVYDNGTRVTLVNAATSFSLNTPTPESQKKPVPILAYNDEFEPETVMNAGIVEGQPEIIVTPPPEENGEATQRKRKNRTKPSEEE